MLKSNDTEWRRRHSIEKLAHGRRRNIAISDGYESRIIQSVAQVSIAKNDESV